MPSNIFKIAGNNIIKNGFHSFNDKLLPVTSIVGMVSIPVTYYFVQGWLNDYDIIPVTPTPFLLSITFPGLVTTLLIVFQIARQVMVPR